MLLWSKARNLVREAIENEELLDKTRIDDFVHGYLDPVLTVGALILQKREELMRGDDLAFLESMLNDFTIRIKELKAVPMVLLSNAESDTSSISITSSSMNEITYYVHICRDVVDNCTRWAQILHEPCHLISRKSKTKEKAEEMFCDLLALRTCGYSYLDASLQHACSVGIDEERGNHPPWRGRLEAMMGEIQSINRLMSEEEKAIRVALKERWTELSSKAGNPPMFYEAIMGGGTYEALAKRRLSEIKKERDLDYDGCEMWDRVVSQTEKGQLKTLSPIELTNAITYQVLSGSDTSCELVKLIMLDWG